MPRRFAKDPRIDKALRHSVKDGVAYSVMTGAGETYFSAFALFLKATTTQIGWLASLPSLVSSLSQLFSVWLSHKSLTRRNVILTGAMVQTMIWIPLIVLPLLLPDLAVPILIVCIVIYHASGSVVVPQWSSLMGDLVPERRRGRYFALRTRFTSVAAFCALIVAGLILDVFEKYELAVYGFVTIFGIANLARCVSVYHLTWLVDSQQHQPDSDVAFNLLRWQRFRHSRIFQFSLFFALMQTMVAVGSPFIAVYMLRDLEFTYVEFMVLSASTVLMQFLTLNAWGRVSDVFGNRLILFVTGYAIPLIPAMWLLSHNFIYLMFVQLLSGLIWAGFNLSAGNFLYDLVPPQKRSTYLAFHNILTNLGIFTGALVGGYLGSVLPKSFSVFGSDITLYSPLLWVFLISCIGRLTIGLIFIPKIKEVRSVKPMTVSGLIFRATRFSALSGMIYDVISGGKRNVK